MRQESLVQVRKAENNVAGRSWYRGMNYDHGLDRVGVKQLKFKQERYNGGGEGECVALTLMWIKQMLSTQTGLFTPGFNDADTAARNTSTFQIARMYQGGQRSPYDHRRIAMSVGLQNIARTQALEESFGSDSNIAVSARISALARQLPPSCGALIQIDFLKNSFLTGHVIGLVNRSAGGLFFFDANVGAYKVLHIEELCAAWQEACRRQGFMVSTSNYPDGYFTLYRNNPNA